MKTRKSLALLLILVLITGFGTSQVLAESASINFEAYTPGNINGQDGWSMTGPHDVAVVANTYGFAAFGAQSLRISNAVTSGSFGDHTFSKPLIDEAGETAAYVGTPSGVRQSYFVAQWDFASTVTGGEQSGLSVVASPDRGDGGRMSWIQMADTPTGLAVNFYDYQDAAPYGSAAIPTDGYGPEDDFIFTNLASGLNRMVAHNIRVEMFLSDGPRNDVVNLYVDNDLKHTGTSWEDYFRWVQGPGGPEQTAPVFESRVIRSMLFRTGGTAAPATAGNGFLIDNLTLFSGPGPACTFTTSGTTMTLNGDCVTDETILIPDGFTLDGNGYTITAIDPAGGHFLGAVVKNTGATAHVTNLTVTTSGLANICDGGDDRLRGILFDGAGGSITDNTVMGINQGASGCQEGNGIEVRNEPFDNSGSDLLVTISGNTVTDYQKNGITANGSVAATITNNLVSGAGPIDYIAQNGIQVGFGGTAVIKGNTVSGNNYTPTSYVACGVLYFQADGVKAAGNTRFGNERDQCNFGKGGGTYNPSP